MSDYTFRVEMTHGQDLRQVLEKDCRQHASTETARQRIGTRMVCETRERLFPNNAELPRGEVEDFLRSQGVTSKKGLRVHETVILGTLRVNKDFDWRSYRVPSENPNNFMMG